MELIILAGMPATGKSTLASRLQARFGYPILEKDNIKEGLFDTLGFSCYAEKRALDVAANEVLLRCLKAMVKAKRSVIVDNNFDAASGEKLGQLLKEAGQDCNVVTVFLNGDPQVLYERYVARDSQGLRHLGHAMQTHYPPLEGEDTTFHMTREGFDRRFLHLGMDKAYWDGTRISVDATYPETIDTDGLIAQIAEILERG
ncbi:MAG: ATP-binding protein [Oscillospiraceae bacterium]|nr:ATP-binding protein [Oscillospiraceae bacterium]